MQLYRPEVIARIMAALDLDAYDDAAQDAALGQDEVPSLAHVFLSLYLHDYTQVLEIGCGSGALFGRYGITHAIEPATRRYAAAVARGAVTGVEVKRNVVEAMEFEDGQFDGAIMLNGFFQVRSDYEALVEINRVLQPGGMFVFSLMVNDGIDVVQGRCLGPRNMRRTLIQFGFDPVGLVEINAGRRFVPVAQIMALLAARKERDFDERWLALPQVDPKHIRNYLPERDWRLI